jgi:hypothetical protein
VVVLNGVLGKNRGEVAVVGGKKKSRRSAGLFNDLENEGYYCQIVAEMVMKRKNGLQ